MLKYHEYSMLFYQIGTHIVPKPASKQLAKLVVQSHLVLVADAVLTQTQSHLVHHFLGIHALGHRHGDQRGQS